MEKNKINLYKSSFSVWDLDGLNLSEITEFLESKMLNDDFILDFSEDTYTIYVRRNETDEEFNSRISAEKAKKQKEEEQERLIYLKLKLKYENI